MGSKGRPFYRVVVAESHEGRNGSFVENIGTFNPVSKPAAVSLNAEKALKWLLNGAQPTETVAYLLKKEGILDQFFKERPNAKKKYGFLNKAISSISVSSTVEANQSTSSEAENKEEATTSA